MAKNCIFCRIVDGSAPSYKIYEDRKYVALLDIYPNIKGQTLVMPKRHTDSYAFRLGDAELRDFIVVAKRVAKLLEKRLKTGRVHMVLEGTAVNHLHAKLYPTLGKDKKFVQAIGEERVHFNCYPGYVTTLMGPRAKDEELKKLQKRITKG